MSVLCKGSQDQGGVGLGQLPKIWKFISIGKNTTAAKGGGGWGVKRKGKKENERYA